MKTTETGLRFAIRNIFGGKENGWIEYEGTTKVENIIAWLIHVSPLPSHEDGFEYLVDSVKAVALKRKAN